MSDLLSLMKRIESRGEFKSCPECLFFHANGRKPHSVACKLKAMIDKLEEEQKGNI